MAENFNDVSAAMDGWTQELTGTRITGTYVSGRWVESLPVGLSFYGVVQSANSEDLKVLPEGDRTEEAIKIHTKFELSPKNAGGGDVIVYQSKTWLVASLKNNAVGGYFKAICTRMD